MTRVLLADDHQLLRQALGTALTDEGFEIIGQAADGEEAVRLADELDPELVMMDVTMPVLDGIEATRLVHHRHPDARVIMLTMHDEKALVAQAIAAGACAFLTKDSSMEDVVATVRHVAEGDVLVSPKIASSMLGELRSPAGTEESPLTKREEEILQQVADGSTTAEVAALLFISAKTVKNHLASIYAKLDARDRTQAVLRGVRIGIIQLH
jgi:DNA-binding NarL/FixJ family response regulator